MFFYVYIYIHTYAYTPVQPLDVWSLASVRIDSNQKYNLIRTVMLYRHELTNPDKQSTIMSLTLLQVLNAVITSKHGQHKLQVQALITIPHSLLSLRTNHVRESTTRHCSQIPCAIQYHSICSALESCVWDTFLLSLFWTLEWFLLPNIWIIFRIVVCSSPDYCVLLTLFFVLVWPDYCWATDSSISAQIQELYLRSYIR